jgi:hypothetical protein
MILIHITASLRQTFHYRASEWALACITLLWSLILLANPNLFVENPSLRSLGSMASQDVWVSGMLVAGGGRLVVLMINGAWHRTPHLRALGAFCSCFFWLEISLGLWHSGIASTGLAVYPVLLLLDSYNVLRAAGDARLADEQYRQAKHTDDPRHV